MYSFFFSCQLYLNEVVLKKWLWNLRTIFILFWALVLSSIKEVWDNSTYSRWLSFGLPWLWACSQFWALWVLKGGSPCREMHPFRYPGPDGITWIWLIGCLCLGSEVEWVVWRWRNMRERGFSVGAAVSTSRVCIHRCWRPAEALCLLSRNSLGLKTGRGDFCCCWYNSHLLGFLWELNKIRYIKHFVQLLPGNNLVASAP